MGELPPNSIQTDMGNGNSFLYTVTDANGSLVYFQRLGCIRLFVLND